MCVTDVTDVRFQGEMHQTLQGPLVQPHKNSERGKVDIPNLVPITAGDETKTAHTIHKEDASNDILTAIQCGRY